MYNKLKQQIIVLQNIYKVIIENGFTSKGQDRVNNKRLGILRSFSDELGNYIEIYKENYGFSVFVYKNVLMNGRYPWRCFVMFPEDLDFLRDKISKLN